MSNTPVREADRVTLGLSQISPKGVREFESKYLQLKQLLIYAYNPDVYSYSDGYGVKSFKALYQGEVKMSNFFHQDQQKEYYAKEPGVVQVSKHISNVMAELQKIENKSE